VTFSQVVWLIGCWLVLASRKYIHKLRKKKKKSIVLLRKEIMNKLVVDMLQQKGLGCWKVLKKRCKQKGKRFLSSQTRWSWQIKRACTSFWTCSSSPGHWSHTQEPSSSHAAASTFRVCARKQNLSWLVILSFGFPVWLFSLSVNKPSKSTDYGPSTLTTAQENSRWRAVRARPF